MTSKKRVLIITYYWPPSGGIGVLRCLKISKYLREFGWEPVIYTAEGATYPTEDLTNFKDILEGTEIIKGKIWEPYSIYKFITRKPKTANVNNVFYTKEKKASWAHKFSVWIRSNFFIPDARCMWIKPSVKKLKKYLEENPVDAIFSNGPPHSNTRIATLLKKETGIPWLADFQDPWTQIDYYQLLSLTKFGDRKHRRMEQEAFKYADEITIVSPSWKKDLEDIGAHNVSVIPWGYDPEDYKALKTKVSDKFIISHLGILGFDRNPEILLTAIKALVDSSDKYKNTIEVQLAGQVDYSVKESIEKNKLNENVKYLGNLTRSDALQLMKDSSLLLLLLNKQSNAKGRIPGKIFEYLAVKRPTLCLGMTVSDSADIIRNAKAGWAYEYEDYNNIIDLLKSEVDKFITNKNTQDLDSDIEQFSIVTQTEKIAALLDSISKSNSNDSKINGQSE